MERSDVRCAEVIAVATWGRGPGGRRVIATNRRGSGQSSPHSLHAEERLLMKLRKLSAIERWGIPRVGVFRMRKDGSFGNSLPCLKCTRQLNAAGIYRVTCVCEGHSQLPEEYLMHKQRGADGCGL